MPTKRTIPAHLPADELRADVEYYELQVADRRVKARLVDALARSRKARVQERQYVKGTRTSGVSSEHAVPASTCACR